ncbi:hypothetical protein C8J57DRAFT_1391672 [Mycena rebaudengoi]|nr:hypothetical protein C8J57DRAFT_1391672 [Mycena rebaudengoi]
MAATGAGRMSAFTSHDTSNDAHSRASGSHYSSSEYTGRDGLDGFNENAATGSSTGGAKVAPILIIQIWTSHFRLTAARLFRMYTSPSYTPRSLPTTAPLLLCCCLCTYYFFASRYNDGTTYTLLTMLYVLYSLSIPSSCCCCRSR